MHTYICIYSFLLFNLCCSLFLHRPFKLCDLSFSGLFFSIFQSQSDDKNYTQFTITDFEILRFISLKHLEYTHLFTFLYCKIRITFSPCILATGHGEFLLNPSSTTDLKSLLYLALNSYICVCSYTHTSVSLHSILLNNLRGFHWN